MNAPNTKQTNRKLRLSRGILLFPRQEQAENWPELSRQAGKRLSLLYSWQGQATVESQRQILPTAWH